MLKKTETDGFVESTFVPEIFTMNYARFLDNIYARIMEYDGECKSAVEDIYGTKALTQEHIAAVNTLFIQVSKDKYFKEKNSE